MIAIIDYDMVKAGNIIRERRALTKLTQEQFAELLGVSHTHFTQIERGVGGMSIQTMLTICHVIGVTPNDLLGYSTPVETVNLLPNALAAALEQCDTKQQEYICKMVVSFLKNNR